MNKFKRKIISKCIKLRNEGIIKGSFHVNDNLEVDVIGSVVFDFTTHETIPVQFGSISNDFECYSIHLKSISGFPKLLGGAFRFTSNNFEQTDENFLVIRNIYNLPDLVTQFGEITHLRTSCVHLDSECRIAYYSWLKRYTRIETINDIISDIIT